MTKQEEISRWVAEYLYQSHLDPISNTEEGLLKGLKKLGVVIKVGELPPPQYFSRVLSAGEMALVYEIERMHIKAGYVAVEELI